MEVVLFVQCLNRLTVIAVKLVGGRGTILKFLKTRSSITPRLRGAKH